MKNKKRTGTFFLLLNILIAIVYFYWRIEYTLPVNSTGTDLVFSIVFLVTEMVGLFLLWFQLFVVRQYDKEVVFEEKEFIESDYPEVDVYVVNYKKKKHITKDTMNACALMDYPDKNKVHIYEINGGMNALNEGLRNGSSPLVAVIEAGMFPRHRFLKEMVKFYLNSTQNGEKVGFIQSVLGAFNSDSYQFRLFSKEYTPNKNRFFDKCQQPVFNNDNSVIYCGSGAIFVREALDEIGGFDEKCVAGFVATSIKLQKQGYICRYLDKILVSGFFATDISECISEWKVKIVDALEAMKNENVLFSGKLSGKQKINYFAYVTSFALPFRSVVTLLLPIISSLYGVLVFECDFVKLLLFWIFMYVTAALATLNITNKVSSLKWNNIRKISTAPFVWIPIVKVFFGINKHENIKKRKTNVFHKIGYFVPFIFVFVLSVLGMVKCVRDFYATQEMYSLIIALWLIVNMYYELMSILWLIGRPYVRQEDRVDASVSYVLTDKINTISGVTRDMSTRGVSIWCDKPYDIDNEEIVNIKLDNGRYQADMQGNVIGVEAEGRRWKYIILFKNMETSRQQYYAMLYDRRPDETTQISGAQNVFGDLNRNVGKRFKHKALEYRRMARIQVNQNVPLADGDEIYVKNYNYKYLLVYSQEKPKDEIVLTPLENVEIVCERFHKFGDHTYMYKVINYDELRKEKEIQDKIYEWVEQCSIENIIGMVSSNNLIPDTDLVGYF